MKERAPIATVLLSLILTPHCIPEQKQQLLSKDDQWRISEILHTAHDEVREHYYDPFLHGLDWDARYQQYSALIPKAVDLGAGFALIASYLDGLKDSHTRFIPPERATRYEYGFRYELVGNDCLVTAVRPGTDAEKKLHVGDQVMRWNGYSIDRENFDNVSYYFNVLAPQTALQLEVRSATGDTRRVLVNSLVRPGSKFDDLTKVEGILDRIRETQSYQNARRTQFIERDDVVIWKMPEFPSDTSGMRQDVKDMYKGLGEVQRALRSVQKHRGLILDLRGNGGGSVETLKMMIGAFFDHDVKIADRVTRKETKPMIAKHSGDPFKGDLIVLIDSQSASASEVMARIMQIEHRGKVLGDVSAGAVMEARGYLEKRGAGTVYYYAFQITDANLVMTDGKSLEKHGVIPDEKITPAAADLAAGRDPVLAHAAEMLGVKLDAAEAGNLFKYEWLPI